MFKVGLRKLGNLVSYGIYCIGRKYSNAHVIGDLLKTYVGAYAVGASGRAIRRREYDEALRILEPVEGYELDDVWVGTAQCNLAQLYMNGWGVIVDENRAMGLFQKAAMAGDPQAIDYLKRRNESQNGRVSESSNKRLC